MTKQNPLEMVIAEGLETGALALGEVELVAAFAATLAAEHAAEREEAEDA